MITMEKYFHQNYKGRQLTEYLVKYVFTLREYMQEDENGDYVQIEMTEELS
jgi:hypothetical protein